jgi:putative transposase
MNSGEKRRHSIRLKDYDYSEAGAYFITICTKTKECCFEIHPELKDILQIEWDLLSRRFPTMIPDCFVVMPNHLHAIIILTGNSNCIVGINQKAETNKLNLVGATLAVAQQANVSLAHPGDDIPEKLNCPPSIGDIVGAYKSLCVNKWLKTIVNTGLNIPGKFWQRNYYEHIIRDEEDLNRVREYIINNPLNWCFDRNNPNHVSDAEYSKKWQWLEEKLVARENSVTSGRQH